MSSSFKPQAFRELLRVSPSLANHVPREVERRHCRPVFQATALAERFKGATAVLFKDPNNATVKFLTQQRVVINIRNIGSIEFNRHIEICIN